MLLEPAHRLSEAAQTVQQDHALTRVIPYLISCVHDAKKVVLDAFITVGNIIHYFEKQGAPALCSG